MFCDELINVYLFFLPYAFAHDYCVDIMPQCLMFLSRLAHAALACQLKPKSDFPLHRLLKEIYASLLVTSQECGGKRSTPRHQSLYTHTHVISYCEWHVPHEQDIYAKSNWHLDQVFFSFPIQLCWTQKKKCRLEWERQNELKAEKL